MFGIEAETIKKYGSFMLIIFSILLIIISGVAFGIFYFTLSSIETGFLAANCEIANNSLVSSCQELWALALYPALALKAIFIWGHTFLIFGAVLGMLFLGYRSGRSGILLGIMTLWIIISTYMGIEISNIYRTFLEIPAFRNMMIEFVFYNRLMLSLPWFMFIVSLFSTMLGLVNYQKSKLNPIKEELDF
jgi:hypothetical protein